MRRINKKGFTLIELLAVIVILGILMLIAIPSVTRFINQSREKTFKNTVQMLVDAVRNDVVSNQDVTCYKTVDNIDLEKGDKSKLVGYVQATKNADGTYTYNVNVIDTGNKFRIVAGEKDIEGTAVDKNVTETTVAAPTTPTGISACK